VHSRKLDRKAARLVRAMWRGGLIDEETMKAGQRALGITPKGEAPAPAPPPEPEPDIGEDQPAD